MVKEGVCESGIEPKWQQRNLQVWDRAQVAATISLVESLQKGCSSMRLFSVSEHSKAEARERLSSKASMSTVDHQLFTGGA